MMRTRVPSMIVLGANASLVPQKSQGGVVVIGNFDGVHRGHRAILNEAVVDAAKGAGGASVLTFDPHPSGVLGRPTPPRLTTLARRVELIGRCGVETIFVRNFDLPFSRWLPERFVDELLVETLAAKKVVVGANFRFGAKRAGDLAMLRQLTSRVNIETQVATLAGDAHGPFSSTRIRQALECGDLTEAEAGLGRRHSFSGIVRSGAGRGRQIGFPTANLHEIPELLPSDGVYAVLVEFEEPKDPSMAGGVMNVGVRPTFEAEAVRSVEVHLFDRDDDFRGKTLRVHLVRRLRGERKFVGVAALRGQIEEDAREARKATEALEPEAE
jgi:riboflavin kinase/FMN adenylyltransferase